MRLALAFALLAAPALATEGNDSDAWRDAVATDRAVASLDADAQAELAALLAEYGERGLGPRLDAARLAQILDDMALAPPAPESWWERAWQWLQSRLEARGWTIPVEWLDALISVGQSTSFEWIARISMLVLIGLAAVVIYREVRHLRWRPVRRPRSTRVAEALPNDAMTWADIAALPRRERPGAALRMVLARLAATTPAFAAVSATHRQIAAEAVRLAPQPRSALVRLAKLAEHARFGRAGSSVDEHDEAVALGRAILGSSRA